MHSEKKTGAKHTVMKFGKGRSGEEKAAKLRGRRLR